MRGSQAARFFIALSEAKNGGTNMTSKRIKLKLLLLIVLAISALGLNRANAGSCVAESCAVVVENGKPVGYGCVAEGNIQQRCTATLDGCAFDSCSGLLN